MSTLVPAATQTGSATLNITIFVVFVAAEGTALLASPEWRLSFDVWQTPMQLMAAPIMIIAGLVAVRAQKRYTGVVLVSVTGLGMVATTVGAVGIAAVAGPEGLKQVGQLLPQVAQRAIRK